MTAKKLSPLAEFERDRKQRHATSDRLHAAAEQGYDLTDLRKLATAQEILNRLPVVQETTLKDYRPVIDPNLVNELIDEEIRLRERLITIRDQLTDHFRIFDRDFIHSREEPEDLRSDAAAMHAARWFGTLGTPSWAEA